MSKTIVFRQDGSSFIEDDRSLANAKDENIGYAKTAASEAIQSAGLDESTQQNAAIGIYPPERCEAIKSYVSACRNEYLRCKGLIQAAQTNDEADACQFLAPPVPEGM
jgi:hypothetical protein